MSDFLLRRPVVLGRRSTAHCPPQSQLRRLRVIVGATVPGSVGVPPGLPVLPGLPVFPGPGPGPPGWVGLHWFGLGPGQGLAVGGALGCGLAVSPRSVSPVNDPGFVIGMFLVWPTTLSPEV